jgi:beta-carotene hydroxylase
VPHQAQWRSKPFDKIDGADIFFDVPAATLPLFAFWQRSTVPSMQTQLPVTGLQSRWKNSRIDGLHRPLVPLRNPADWRSLFFLAVLAVLFSVQWTGLFRHWLLLPATCVLAFIACVIKHNHIHCRTFSSRGWNFAFEHFLGLCTGQSTAAIIGVHNERHHAQHQTDRDCVRSSIASSPRNWLNLALFPLAAVRGTWRSRPGDMRRWRAEKPGLYHRVQQQRAVVAAFIAALLLLDWRATLLYFGVPWLFAQWGIVTINLLQHQDCDHGTAYDHSRNITGRFINWLFLNSGFHTAHHLRPALHWSRLPEFHRAQIAPNMRPELNHRSLVVCIWKQFFSAAEKQKS